MELRTTFDKNNSITSVEALNMGKPKSPLVEKYLSIATIHGAAQIHEASKIRTRLFWTVILMTLLTIFTYYMYKDFHKFFKYDVQITTTFDDNEGIMPFLAITFCNANRVSLKTFQEIFGVNKGDVTLKYCQSINFQEGPFVNQTILTKLSNMDNFFVPLTCRFNSLQCRFDERTFRRHETIVFGTCFTFNYHGNYTQTIPGPDYGLRVMANINQFDYFPCDFFYNAKPAGVFVLVHNPGSTPDYRTPLIAAPGALTRIELGKTSIERLQDPYIDNCRRVGDSSEDEFPILTHSTYTVEHCYYTCYIFKMNASCNEVDFESAFIAMRHGVNFRYNSSTPSACIEKFKIKFNSGQVSCRCRSLCEEHDYVHSINSSPWPADVAMQRWQEKISFLNGQPPTEENVRKNAVAIEIYFTKFKVLRTIHSEAYDLGSMFSDIGGLSGLLIGGSIFSLFEFIVLLLQLLRNKLTKK